MLIAALRRYVPILGWLPAYQRAWLTRDVLAGVTITDSGRLWVTVNFRDLAKGATPNGERYDGGGSSEETLSDGQPTTVDVNSQDQQMPIFLKLTMYTYRSLSHANHFRCRRSAGTLNRPKSPAHGRILP